MVFVLRRASTVNIFYSFIVLKTSMPVVTIFRMRHLYGKMYLNCEIYGSTCTTSGVSEAGQNMQKANQNSSLVPHI